MLCKYVSSSTKRRDSTKIAVVRNVNYFSLTLVEAIELCRSVGLELLLRPPNTTSHLQPEDVVMFKPFKAEVARLKSRHTKTNLRKQLRRCSGACGGKKVANTPASLELTWRQLSQIVREAYSKIFTAENIMKSFKTVGLQPFTMRKFWLKVEDEKMRAGTPRPERVLGGWDNDAVAAEEVRAMMTASDVDSDPSIHSVSSDSDMPTDPEERSNFKDEKAARLRAARDERLKLKGRGAPSVPGNLRNITGDKPYELQKRKLKEKEDKDAATKANKAKREQKKQRRVAEAKAEVQALLDKFAKAGGVVNALTANEYKSAIIGLDDTPLSKGKKVDWYHQFVDLVKRVGEQRGVTG